MIPDYHLDATARVERTYKMYEGNIELQKPVARVERGDGSATLTLHGRDGTSVFLYNVTRDRLQLIGRLIEHVLEDWA